MDTSRKNVFALAACQSLLVTNNVMMISIGTLAADTLAKNKFLVTVPATAYIIGGGLATLPVSFLMKRYGRRAGFILGCLFGMVGGALAAAAMALHSFGLLCVASLVAGVYTGSGGFYRFAAADTVSADFRSKAISLVLAGGIVGGVFGPESTKVTKDLLDVTFLGSFLSLIVLAFLAILILLRLDLPMPSHEERHGQARPLASIMRQPVFIVAVLGSITAYGVMNLLMAAAPLAMQFCAHPYNAAVLVIEWHIIAMFAPAFVTGWLVARFGVLRIMFIGVLLMIAAVAVAVSSISVSAFWTAMVLVGVAWCFLFVGGTTLLTECYSPAEKAKTQGIHDLLIYVTMGTTSVSSGAILYKHGWNTLNYCSLPLLTITTIAILWLAAQRRSHLTPALSPRNRAERES
ncbi:MAG TPA: MFS transporter [Burkholderiales bacterium]|nr:MFS transporter [Burkholderiales bacterium]